MEWVLWPIIGWVSVYFAMPKRILEDDPFGFSYVVIFVCGGIVGPIGIFWLLLELLERPK